MEQAKYNISWCKSESEFPKTETPCPKCETGFIYKSKWGGVYCNECKYKWRLSKWAEKEPKPKSTNGTAMMYEEVMAGFKEINERLDKVIAYLTQKLK